jgi:hypothetical protein
MINMVKELGGIRFLFEPKMLIGFDKTVTVNNKQQVRSDIVLKAFYAQFRDM